MPAMTRAEAKTFIARPVSHTPGANELTRAQEALEDAIELWNVRHDWNYLLMDTSNSFSVASCTVAGDGITVTSTNSLQAVNVGVTVTGTGITGGNTIGARTSVGGTVTLQLQLTSTPGTITLTFGGTIPIRANVDTYYMPSPFKRHSTARTITQPRKLEWKSQSEIDMMFARQSDLGPPEFYNIYNPASFSQALNAIARVFPIPQASDTGVFRFYRPIAIPTAEGESLDLPSRYVRPLLWCARYLFLLAEEGDTSRTQNYRQLGEDALRWAMADDDPQSADDDMRIKSQMETNASRHRDSSDITGLF